MTTQTWDNIAVEAAFLALELLIVVVIIGLFQKYRRFRSRQMAKDIIIKRLRGVMAEVSPHFALVDLVLSEQIERRSAGAELDYAALERLLEFYADHIDPTYQRAKQSLFIIIPILNERDVKQFVELFDAVEESVQLTFRTVADLVAARDFSAWRVATPERRGQAIRQLDEKILAARREYRFDEATSKGAERLCKELMSISEKLGRVADASVATPGESSGATARA